MRTEDYLRKRRKILTVMGRFQERLDALDDEHRGRVRLPYRQGEKYLAVHRAMGRGWKTLKAIRDALLTQGASPLVTEGSISAILRRESGRMGWTTRVSPEARNHTGRRPGEWRRLTPEERRRLKRARAMRSATRKSAA